MASQWFYKACVDHNQPESGLGPVTFQQLAHLLVDGKLTSDSIACRKATGEWQPLDQIVGLSRLADRIRSRSAEAPARRPQDDVSRQRLADDPTFATTDNSAIEQSTGDRQTTHLGWRIVLGLTGLVVFGWMVSWWMRPRWERFPRPARMQNTPGDGQFPVIGDLNRFEMGLLVVDVLIGVLMIILWFRRRVSNRSRGRHHGGTPSATTNAQ